MNRLTDDQQQARIRDEAQAVEQILRTVREGKHVWITSHFVAIEIDRNPDLNRRFDASALLAFASEVVVPTSHQLEEAKLLETLGFGAFDALHLMSAKSGKADAFLTTDDDLIRRTRRHSRLFELTVANPVSWISEVL
jgi:predicted nucleic acid-binding protein